MSGEDAEGTLAFDGLIEGTLPAQPDLQGVLKSWIAEAEKQGLAFHLELDGSSFSLLPEAHPVPAAGFGSTPAQSVVRLLEGLVSSIPRPQRDRMFSTIRSREFRKDSEVQTVYVVREGVIEPLARTIGLRRERSPASLPQGRGLHRASWIAGIAALAILFLLDAGGLLTRLRSILGPGESGEVRLDASDFGDLLDVKASGVRPGTRTYWMTIERGPGFPPDDAAMLCAMDRAKSTARRLALESLARGYARCEFFDADGRFVGSASCRLRELHKQQRSEVSLPLPENVRVRRVALTF